MSDRAQRLRIAIIAAAVAAIAAATLAAYAPATSGGFYLDDERNIVDNQALHIDALEWPQLRRALAESPLLSRPLSNLSLAINHRYSKLDPAPYHWTNIALHIATGLAVFWVAWIVARGRSARWAAPAAVVAMGVFLLHPLNTQAVSYVVQRMAVLCALFATLSLGAYLSARGAPDASRLRKACWLLASFVAFCLALLSKENAITLVPVLCCYELAFHGSYWRRTLGARWRRGLLSKLILAGSVAVIALGVALVAAQVFTLGPMNGRDFTGVERLLTQARVQALYLGLAVWPSPSALTLEHSFEVSRSLLDPWTTLPLVACWIGGLGALTWLAWRGVKPWLVWPLLAYALFHSIEAAPVSLELVFEHRMYLPFVALMILIAAAIAELLQRGRLAGTRRRVVALVALAALLALGLATHRRNQVWGDPETFFVDCVRKAPDAARARYNLGTWYDRQERYELALAEYAAALEIQPAYFDSLLSSGIAHAELGHTDEAIEYYLAALRIFPGSVKANFNLGLSLLSRQRFSEAAFHFDRVVRLDPSVQQAYQFRAYALEKAHAQRPQ